MKQNHLAALLGLAFLAIGCSGEKRPDMSKEPISVRGWIRQISPPGNYMVADPARAYARRLQLLRDTSIAVEGITYASGGVSETGAFVILDVPPGHPSILFNAPGIPNVPLKLQNIPPNADVFVPALALRPDSVEPLEPDQIMVRIPAPSGAPKRNTGTFAVVGGVKVPVIEVPMNELMDRRDYPEVPMYRGMPTVR